MKTAVRTLRRLLDLALLLLVVSVLALGSGARSRITWIWPGEVCVRRMTFGVVVY